MNFLSQYNAGGVALEPRLPFLPLMEEKEPKEDQGARGAGQLGRVHATSPYM